MHVNFSTRYANLCGTRVEELINEDYLPAEIIQRGSWQEHSIGYSILFDNNHVRDLKKITLDDIVNLS